MMVVYVGTRVFKLFSSYPAFIINHRNFILNASCVLYKKYNLDFSKVPTIKESDLKETFIRGSGPGGQAVNKTNNCVSLLHKPTGIRIKCHQTRSQSMNRRIARELLVTRLDDLINKEDSLEGQKKRADEIRSRKLESKKKKLADLKKEWKTTEG